jgi:hypothetical protein
MKRAFLTILPILLQLSCSREETKIITVSFTSDHNRMLVNGEVRRQDNSRRKVRLWVDTGNPDLFLSPELAKDIGIALPPDSLIPDHGFIEVSPPTSLYIGGMRLNTDSVTCYVVMKRHFFFTATHCDMNLPSTILKKYDVMFDYPGRKMTLGVPGEIHFHGVPVAAAIHPLTGIIQIDGMADGDSLSFALDNGASYSFGSTEFFSSVKKNHPGLPVCTGAVGCANIWGWGPKEETWLVVRIPEMKWGSVHLVDIGMTIPPDFTPDGQGMMDWYSRKTVRPVDGFLGPDAYSDFCIGIDYRNQKIYFYKTGKANTQDMNLVGLTVRPESDSSWTITGVARINGLPMVEGVEAGDKLTRIGRLGTRGKTMGTVVGALRGKPGEEKDLILERNGKEIRIKTEVKRIL